ncbi:MAG: bifunctional UDP-N-acetylglucosamine diphosphorylase/glucosamine-1-phosphate N-acetyltransferase GlmU [Chloroflexi bacterium]|nr:bifunctional UDP-N-acetylglucosamine diphosphorylase/glucosamine-1-phosphate N-acetyltransferase GlmU [Chloroflexota bacterium]
MNIAAVILAAGQGTRMKSDLPKVLHPIAGKPMVLYALETARALNASTIALVTGHGGDQVRAAIPNYQLLITNLDFVEQRDQRGTGHAVLQARDALRGKTNVVLVMYADMPLLKIETLQRLIDRHAATRGKLTMLTVVSNDSMGFGRILRDPNQRVIGIVEDADATPAQREIRELNCGVYCFDADWLWDNLAQLEPSGKKQEYYLTDLVARAVAQEILVEAETLNDVTEVIGINTRVHLAQAEKIARQRINERWMLDGVTLVDPATTYIDADVEIGMDTRLEPNTQLKGRTRIGAHCVIGANSEIKDSEIGDDCEVRASTIEDATLEDHVEIGPYSHLRGGAYLSRGVHLGNYVEVKNSRLAEEVKAGHFSYLGDAEIGARTNIGAGTITCNFDGAQKNKTIIGADAFIGSDTMLVAPVTIGDRARTGAGSVVTKNVPSDSLAVGAPARVIRKFVNHNS